MTFCNLNDSAELLIHAHARHQALQTNQASLCPCPSNTQGICTACAQPMPIHRHGRTSIRPCSQQSWSFLSWHAPIFTGGTQPQSLAIVCACTFMVVVMCTHGRCMRMHCFLMLRQWFCYGLVQVSVQHSGLV